MICQPGSDCSRKACKLQRHSKWAAMQASWPSWHDAGTTQASLTNARYAPAAQKRHQALIVGQCFAAAATWQVRSRARKLPLEISTSWWKGLGQSRPAVPQGASWRGQVHFGGRIGRTTPRFGFEISISWSRPFHNFRNFGPSAREFRPVDELANPGQEPSKADPNGV
jgi:hypothetical protein